MTKIITLLMFALLVLNAPFVCARESIGENAKDFVYEEYIDDDYDFSTDENSFYISDEQAQEDVKNIDKIDEPSSFDDKVINSSHFSSGTATRTWIPINRVK